MKANEEAMSSAKLELSARDYCAHKLIDYKTCRRDHFPWVYKCHHQKHDYHQCEYQEWDFFFIIISYKLQSSWFSNKIG